MNIWIVSSGEPLPIDGNPRLRRMGMLSQILVQRGHEVHWFASTFHHYKKMNRFDNDKIIKTKDNLFMHLLYIKGYQKNVSLKRLKSQKEIANKFSIIAEDQKNSPDIILTTLAPLELSKAATEFGAKYSIPVVTDIRDLWPEIYKEVVPRWAKSIITPYIWYSNNKLKKILRKSTSVIGVTPNFLDYALKTANIQKREYDRVFYTSYKKRNLDRSNEEVENSWLKYNIKYDDFIVLFLGNFGKQFELTPVIEAASYNSNIKFVLCGLGENLEDVKLKAKDKENIIFPGWIDENEINTILSIADIGVAPYRNSINFTGNTPNKFGEYLSASLPILVGIPGIMKDLLESFNCGYFYKDSKDLGEKINNLYNDRISLKNMSLNASKLYDQKFNAQIVYPKLADHIERIAKTNRK